MHSPARLLSRSDRLTGLLISLTVALTVLTGRVDYSASDPFLSMFTAQRCLLTPPKESTTLTAPNGTSPPA